MNDASAGRTAEGIAVRELGAGPPLLLVRPLGGSMTLWGGFAETLAERFRVIMFDARGSGGSRPLAARTTTRAMARDAVTVLDALRVDRAAVFGQSLGGMVATWIALDAGDRVTSLVLASTALEGTAFTRTGPARGLGFALCMARPAGDVEACMTERVLSPEMKRASPARVREIQALTRAAPSPRRTLVSHGLAGAGHRVGGRARSLRVATCWLAGEHDALVGVEPQRGMARRIGAARFAIIRGAGHDVTLEAPYETAAQVAAFLEAQR